MYALETLVLNSTRTCRVLYWGILGAEQWFDLLHTLPVGIIGQVVLLQYYYSLITVLLQLQCYCVTVGILELQDVFFVFL